MHTRSLLDAWLRRNCSFIHRARLKALVKLVDSLLVGGKATVAELGRNMRTLAYEKHAIKCADRLIGTAACAGPAFGGGRGSPLDCRAHVGLSNDGAVGARSDGAALDHCRLV